MPAGGLHAQFGVAAETVWGTPVTVTRFYELLSEDIAAEFARVESEAIRAGQLHIRSDDWTNGVNRFTGSFDTELSTKNMALLFRHALGSVATTGTGPFTHTITPGSKAGLGLTMQAGRPGSGGTVHPFTWAGGKISGFELSFAVDETARVSWDVVAKSQTTATVLATANYTASNALLAYTHGSITIGGGAAKVKGGSVTYTVPLNVDRVFVGDDEISEPLENGRREATFSLDCEFEDLTAYNRIVNGTEAAISLAFTRGTDSVTVSGNARFDGDNPTIDDMDLLDLTLTGKFAATAADSTAFQVVVVSSESTP